MSEASPSSQQDPWQRHSARQIYENAWISLTEHQVTSPGGKPGIYGVVHFKGDAIGVVPYSNGYIWLVGQYRFPLEQYSWEIPEGGSHPGESPQDCAHRELLEETGFKARNLSPLFEMHLSNAVSDEWGQVFLATGLEAGEAQPDHAEQLTLRKVRLEDAFAEVEAGQITDSLSVAAIFRLMIMQLQGKLPKE